MSETKTAMNTHIEDGTPCECDNCDWRGTSEQVEDIASIGERLDPGGEVPVGQCPECGSLCYVSTPDAPEVEQPGGNLAEDIKHAMQMAEAHQDDWETDEGLDPESKQHAAASRVTFDRARKAIERMPALVAVLARVLPYALSRAEDLQAHKDAGNEDPAFPGAAEACEAVEAASRLLAELDGAGVTEGSAPAGLPKLAIVMDGGLIQSIHCDQAQALDCVVVVDYDVEGAEEASLYEVKQADGRTEPAHVSAPMIEAWPAIFDAALVAEAHGGEG